MTLIFKYELISVLSSLLKLSFSIQVRGSLHHTRPVHTLSNPGQIKLPL